MEYWLALADGSQETRNYFEKVILIRLCYIGTKSVTSIIFLIFTICKGQGL